MGRSLPFLRATLSVLLAVLVSGPVRGAQESPEEQYQYVAGLCERGLYDVAVREAEAFLRDHPRHARATLARYRLASSLFELQRLPEAARQYEQLGRVGDFEYAAEVQFRLGQCQLDAGATRDAARTFARVTRMDKAYLVLPATFFLGEAHLAAGDFSAAAESYGAVLSAEDPGEYERDAEYGLVWCAFRLGDSEQSLHRIATFLRERPRDPAADELRFLMGEAHLAAGRPQRALEAYGKVGAGDYSEAALRGQAFALAAAGDHPGAARRFEQLLKRFPAGSHAEEARLHAGIEWLHAEEPQRAAPHLRSPQAGTGALTCYWRAQVELDLDRPEDALLAVDAALAQSPDADLARLLHTLRGDALSDLGRADEALHSYGRSGSEYATYAAAVAALNDGRPREAGRLAQAVLEQQPDSDYTTDLQLVLGEALLAEDQPQRAEAAFRAVVEVRPPSKDAPRARLRLGWCRFLQDDPAGAAGYFEQSLAEQRQGPAAEEASFMLGRAQEAAGEVPAAIRTWSEHVGRFPEGAHRSEVLEGLARLDTQRSARWVDLLLGQPGGPSTRSGTGSGASREAGARALLGLAERAAAAGQTETAVQRYAEFLERFPAHSAASRARYGHAWGLYELGQPAQAAAGLTEVAADRAAEESTRLSALELSIWAWSEAGEPDRAFEAYRSFARVAPDDARLWAAAQVVQKALAAADRSADAGRVIEDFLGRVQTPEPALEALIESTWWALDAGGLEAAEAAARGGVKIARRSQLESPRLGEACFFVAERRFEESELVAAGELYALAATWGDGEVRPRAFYKLGFSELGRERWREATEAFRALTEAYPRHELYGEALFLAGESEFRAARFAGAEELLARLVREQPKHEVVPKALFRRGVALGQLERWQECAEVLGELNRRAPEFTHGAEAELWRGRALAALGDRRGARAAFERVIALDEGVLSARARLGLGHGEFDAGEFDAALSQFLRVVVLYASGEEVAEALLFSGRCLEELGNQERAREQYRQVLEEHPESASARGARERLAGLGN